MSLGVTTMIIGVTGRMAAGKSTLTHLLSQRGVRIIASDALTRIALQLPQCQSQLSQLMGISRAVTIADLRCCLTDHPEHLAKVEGILQPAIAKKLSQQLAHQKHLVTVVEIPLLIEAGWQQAMDWVCVVVANEHLRASRLRKRAAPAALTATLLARQWSDRRKQQHADTVLRSGLSKRHLLQQAALAWQHACPNPLRRPLWPGHLR